MAAEPILHVRRHRGITLLEVLISMGILTIGLVSVLSLIPTGRSFAVKATIYDRATAVAENALADVVNRGYLDPARFTLSTSLPTRVDFLGVAAGAPLAGNTCADIASTTIWSVNTSSVVVPYAICSSSDDLVYAASTADDPPTPGRTTNGMTVAENKFSWVATLTTPSGGALSATTPGTPVLLSVVVFHRRDITSAGQFTVSSSASGTTITVPGVTAASAKDYLRAGNIILVKSGSTYSWRRLMLAAFDDATSQALLTVDGANNLSGTVTVTGFIGAVGLAERLVQLEGPSPWSLP